MRNNDKTEHRYRRNVILFALLLVLVLKTVSWLLVCSENMKNPLENQSGSAIVWENKNSIDVVFMGDSNVQSSVSPAELWKKFGMTAYVWGGACYQMYETEHNLTKMFRHQSPKVVFIEVNPLQSSKTEVDAINQKVKADVGNIFEMVLYNRYMKNLFPNRWHRWSIGERSLSKGYWFQTKTQGYLGGNWMADTGDVAQFPRTAERSLQRCVQICKENGAIPVLLATVSPYEWNMGCHNRTTQLAKSMDVDFLDLNLQTQEMGLDCTQDFSDGGLHMNYKGAQKNCLYIGQYLAERYKVADHRSESAYLQWNKDCETYLQYLETAIEKGKQY